MLELPDGTFGNVAIEWPFRSAIVNISRYRCLATERAPAEEQTQPWHVICFPHERGFLYHEEDSATVVDPTDLFFLNAGVRFRTSHPFGCGDCGSTLVLRPDVLLEAMAVHDPSVHDRPGRPFPCRRAPSAPPVYLTQRLLARELEDPVALDPSGVIETALALAACAVASAFPAAKAARPSAATRRERQARERVEGVRSEIARAYDRHQPLEELAAGAGCSVYHLCRIFRRHTGLPVHRYRNRLRLRAALERLADPKVDLTGVALDVGFSSHSHFTAAFRAEFGVTPSQVRRSRFKAIRSRLFWPPASKRNVSVM
jgi:AraC family transcriptional regulator